MKNSHAAEKATKPQVNSLKKLVRDAKPIEWRIPGMLPAVGTTMVVADAKAGKSTMMIGLSIEVARGGKAFGVIPLGEPKEVLYCGLEFSDNSFGRKVQTMLGDSEPPELFNVATSWKMFYDGGIEDLENYKECHPDLAVAVFDTYGRIKKPSSSYSYDADVKELTEIQNLAEQLNIAIVLMHHARKGLPGDNPIYAAGGTQGITGSVSTVWMLTGSYNETKLHTVGWEVGIEDYTLNFDEDTQQLTLVSCGNKLTTKQQEIVNLLNGGNVMSPSEIADALGIEVNKVKQRIITLERKNVIVKIERGQYKLSGDYKLY